MIVKYRHHGRPDKTYGAFSFDTETVSEFIERKLFCDGDYHSSPSPLENAEEAHKALGRLIEILADKGVINTDDILGIVNLSPCSSELTEAKDGE